MRQLSVILLLISLLGQTFSRYSILLDYRLNKSYIVRNLCVNRDKPEMKCEGKCYLCRKLKHEDGKDQDNPERKAENRNDIVLSSRSFAPFLESISLIEITVKLHYPQGENGALSDGTNFIFRPPKA